MATISIQHIGPLVDTGVITITPVTLIIGEQSTGKSTLMKILCFCAWVEKHVMIDGDRFLYNYTHYHRFRRELMKFHRLSKDFFSSESKITYVGDAVRIELEGLQRNAKIIKLPGFAEKKHNRKNCFLPAERNLLSSTQHIEKLYRTSDFDLLFNFIVEWGEAKVRFTPESPLQLPFVRNMRFFYDKASDREVVHLTDKEKKISPFYASSGIQSALPVSVMANYLSQLVGRVSKYSPLDYFNVIFQQEMDAAKKENIEALIERFAEQRGEKGHINLPAHLEQLEKLYTYRSFSLFVEEPEQNIYPKSQFALLRSLIALLKTADGAKGALPSQIVLTTHSPYVLTALNVMMKAAVAHEKDAARTEEIIPLGEILPVDAYSAYYITPEGTVASLVDEEYHFIRGDELDSVSECVDDYMDRLNDVLYAND